MRIWTVAAHYDVPKDVERQQLQTVEALANTAPEDVAIIATVQRPQAQESTGLRKWGERLGLLDKPESWVGTRTYDLTREPVVLSTTPRSIGSGLAEALKNHPSQHTAILLGGHGAGYLGAKGMSVAGLAETLQEATQGEKVDLLILHSCLMGNLETLRQLAPFAHYAVVSENSQAPRPLDLGPEDFQGDARVLGTALVEAASAGKNVTTLSLIDLSKVEALSQSLERLAPELEKQPAETREALAQPFPLGSETAQTALGVADLGILLHALGDSPQVEECHALLREAVVANKATHLDAGSEGLSIRTGTSGGLTTYAELGGMPRWAQMLGVIAQYCPKSDPDHTQSTATVSQ